ncbi:hypothetical protein CEXT_406351 [Caerostris extrusa]|uniref:Uncharacterized protein n=1 Tax=Caerostris extrusa TaxID=172846 RepID=A0AAV4QRL2_CAEEX|nr:hypothetical protein CEXT_406351 [Caerostris extrusa]
MRLQIKINHVVEGWGFWRVIFTFSHNPKSARKRRQFGFGKEGALLKGIFKTNLLSDGGTTGNDVGVAVEVADG